jgi:hypothetical protein
MSAAVLGFAVLSPAVADTSFGALAAADGIRSQVIYPGAPLTDALVDSGGPTAQARLTSIGISTGFAAYPDPGATVLGAPATAGTSAVSYPFAVSSSYPVTPTASSANGPYALTATSADQRSTAGASSGSSDPATATGALLSAHADVQLQGTTVTAKAETDDRSLAGGPLSIGRVHATAEVTRGGSAAAVRKTSFSAEGMSASGLTFGVGPGGLTVAGSTVPLPDASPVTSVLAGAGITITYFAPELTADSARSAGVAVVMANPAGGSTTYLIGFTYARISQTVTDDGSAGVVTGVTGPPATFGGAPAPSTPLTSGASVPAPAQAAGSPDLAAAPAVAAPVPEAAPALRPAANVVGWPRSYFLVLAGGGLLAAVGAVLMSLLGVRYP